MQTFHYPSAAEVDLWAENLYQQATSSPGEATVLSAEASTQNRQPRHSGKARYVKFRRPGGREFWGLWQTVHLGPAPLLVHVPGYGTELSEHPELVQAGFNVLHVSPLGFNGPQGPDQTLVRDGLWPVLPDTVLSAGKKGYCEWLADAVAAVLWALGQDQVLPGRVSFFGTSQGGGGSLLLGSIFRDHGIRAVAADVPFLTNFPLVFQLPQHGAYAMAFSYLPKVPDQAAAWRALGFIDTISHAHRLGVPVLLTSGDLDEACPPSSIISLHARLPGTRALVELQNQVHDYTRPFLDLTTAWFRLYA